MVCQQEKCLSAGAGVHYLVSSPVSNEICCSWEDKVYRQLTREEACWFERIDINALKLPGTRKIVFAHNTHTASKLFQSY